MPAKPHPVCCDDSERPSYSRTTEKGMSNPRNGIYKSTKRKRVLDWYCFEKNPRFCCGSGSFKQETKRRRRKKILLLVVIYLHTKTHANTYYFTDTIKLLLTDKFKKEQQTVRHNL